MKKIAFVLFFSFGFLFAYDVHILSQENKDGKVSSKTIEAEFKKAGFYISYNRDMNIPFKKRFNNTHYKRYNLLTLYPVSIIKDLAQKYPSIGLFTPLSMAIFTKKGSDRIHVSYLTSDALSKITKIPQKDLKPLEMAIRKVLMYALPKGEYQALEYEISKTQKQLVTKMQISLKKKNWENEIEEFIESFEEKLEKAGFVQASYTDINYDFKTMENNIYDFFASESICKLSVIYSVSKTRPEAGAFAPCAISMYKKKNENILYIEYPNVYNWISSLSLDDKKAIKALLKSQAQMETILYEIKE